jgi:hypothetical protein
LKVEVMVRLSPAGMGPRKQGKAVVQWPPFETKVNPAGVVSLTVALAAFEGPRLVTVIT